MKAQAISISKGVAEIIESDIPEPRRSEVLVETKACGICMGDVYAFQGKLPGGRVMGHEGVGIVAKTGEDVRNVKPGERVTTLGGPAFAQFYRTDCRNIARIPDDVEDLALWISEPAACAVNGIKRSAIQIGDKVCIIGCGYMGLLLLQSIPKAIVDCLVAVDLLNERLDLAMKFGADHAVNPREVKAVEEVRRILGGEADIVIEASGAPGALYLATDLLKPSGKLVIFGRHVVDETVPTEKWHVKGLTILNTSPASSPDFNKDFHDAVKLLEKRVFDQNLLMTHRFPYRDAMAAFRVASDKPADYIKGVITF